MSVCLIGYEPGGRALESLRARHINEKGSLFFSEPFSFVRSKNDSGARQSKNRRSTTNQRFVERRSEA